MSIDWKEESQRFDGVAAAYDEFRPSYPDELIETIVTTTRLAPGARILEIGCGTGKATVLFAARGYVMQCVEPGVNLAAIAARNCKPYPVQFAISRFEEWSEPAHEFELAISAQAFHWVPKEIGYRKLARALKPEGWLALFWNRYPHPPGAIYDELEQVYRENDPMPDEPRESIQEEMERTKHDITAGGLFGDVQVITFPWSARYNTREYLGLLNTHSDHLRMAEPERARLLARIAGVIDAHGGYLDRPYLATLYLARKTNREEPI